MKGGNAAVAAAAIAGDADNSDEEVYATAKAFDGGAEMDYDSDDNPIVVSSSWEMQSISVLESWQFHSEQQLASSQHFKSYM